jgi:Phage tail protein.
VTITYTNTLNESITLKQTKPYFLTRLDGTGNIKQAINTFKAPGQDGAFYISSSLDMRNITIEGTIFAYTPDEAYIMRRQLLRIFTPKQQGFLIVRNRRIGCVIEEAGFTVSTRERLPKFFISLLCPSQFFETLDEIRRELALWMPLFSFVLEIPDGGIEFGSRQPSQIITVDNGGDVPCGCTIVFSAIGSVVNPELMNVDTGEYVKLNTTMAAEEELRVNTHFANKRVTRIISQTETNAFSTLDSGSTFLQLAVGQNTLRYDADENIDLLEVSIYYRELFLEA